MTDIGYQVNRCDESNNLATVLLGLIKLLDEISDGIDDPVSSDAENITEKDELLTSALLGMLSFRRTLYRWLDSIENESAALPTASEPTIVADGRGLLR